MQTIPDSIAAELRHSLIVTGAVPSPLVRRTRWLALLHHRRHRQSGPERLRRATPDDAA